MARLVCIQEGDMELPFVYIDSLEQNADIANASSFIAQARRIIASDAVSEGVKQEIFATAMECIADIKRYYQAKQKEEQLLKMDAEIDGKIMPSSARTSQQRAFEH
ncbi:hypothetical protein COOONC_01060 [Cooperia oncophora]